jgi:bifunctional DNA-binding transcriptional regulator/antitoxin component of YhaV-PrlF toxin-antitoxin module
MLSLSGGRCRFKGVESGGVLRRATALCPNLDASVCRVGTTATHRLGSMGQVVIQQDLRERWGLVPGTPVVIEDHENGAGFAVPTRAISIERYFLSPPRLTVAQDDDVDIGVGSGRRRQGAVLGGERLVESLGEGDEEPVGGGHVLTQLPDSGAKGERRKDLDGEVGEILDGCPGALRLKVLVLDLSPEHGEDLEGEEIGYCQGSF